MNAQRILAIDPGFERVGIAIVAKENRKEILIYSCCFRTSRKDSFAVRIRNVGNEIDRIIKKFKPEALAIETLFFNTNQRTVMNVAEARGVIMYECSQAQMKIFEYSPLQIKIAVTSYGKSTKDQVIMMTRKLIDIGNAVTSDDEIDAIAIGLTCFAHEKSLIK